ncbi:MAG: hypothetical protein ABR909_12690 [Candidatus Bathyarchaeia archaeon]
MQNINRVIYLWSNIQAGRSAQNFLSCFVYGFFFMFEKAGLSLVITQRLYLYLLFVLAGLSMYYLASTISPNDCNRRIVAWIAALFYMFNPVTLILYQSIPPSYFGTPLILALFVKAMDANFKNKVKFGLLASIFLFSYALEFPDYEIPLVLLMFLVIFSIIHLAFNRKDIRNVLTTWGVFLGLGIILNLWMIIGIFNFFLGQITSYLNTSAYLFGSTAFGDLGGTIMVKVFTLTPYVPSFYYQAGNLLILINFIFPILAFITLLIVPKKSRNIIFITLLTLIAIILVTGPNPPLGWLYQWFLPHFSFLIGFRTVGSLIMFVALGYSILIGISVAFIFKKLRNAKFFKVKHSHLRRLGSIAFVIIIIALICTNGWPEITGSIFNTSGVRQEDIGKVIPDAYYQADQWLMQFGNLSGGRVLVLPPTEGYQSATWGSYSYYGPSVEYFILSEPAIYPGYIGFGSDNFALMPSLVNSVESENYSMIYRLAELLNVKYILVDGYTDNSSVYLDMLRSSVLSNATTINVSFVKNFGNLFLYELTTTLNSIYIPSHIELINGGVDNLVSSLSTNNYTTTDFALFSSDQLSPSENLQIKECSSIQNSNNIINAKELNPTEYTVQVNASSPFFLVLGQNYDSGWQASVNGKNMGQHLVVNGYANAWYINKTGTYTITLEYQPQNLFYAGIAISIIALIVCVMYLSKNKIKNIYKKYAKKSKTGT